MKKTILALPLLTSFLLSTAAHAGVGPDTRKNFDRSTLLEEMRPIDIREMCLKRGSSQESCDALVDKMKKAAEGYDNDEKNCGSGGCDADAMKNDEPKKDIGDPDSQENTEFSGDSD